jgi:hypothetical protein
LVNKGEVLDSLNRRKQAVTTYRAVVKRFAAATDLAIKGQVAKAQNAIELKPSAPKVKTH